ncbi:sensor domain-containing diguanylate cyclase [Vibrio sonorensis]|uniref:sensor domain-containing diguanylate cyclase n=1 Tax=Vibrio sonorensis TaxID=1004316 RepID=UPI0008DA238A|nr:sensor domain-containing diguanylate cyclase [Vibrio sonorensis]
MNSVLSKTLANNPHLMHSVFESLPEPTFLLNKKGVYVEAWGGTDTSRHHNPSTLIGLDQYQVLPADKAVWFSQVIVDVIESMQPAELEYALDPKDLRCFDGVIGPTSPQWFSALVIPLPDTEYVLWTVRNITEYKKALDTVASQQLKLEKMTHLDHLTGVYNRSSLESLLPDALALARLNRVSVSIYMIDIDDFKQLNHDMGHLKGDEILKQIGDTIGNWMKPGELGFRYDGNEFLIYLPGLSKQESLTRATELQSLIHSLQIPNPNSSVGGLLTVTLGVYYHPRITRLNTLEELIGLADKALFSAKQGQRSTVQLYNSE